MTASRVGAALITGASAGIGRALAIDLAKKSSYKTIGIMGRNKEKLIETQKIMKDNEPTIESKIITHDFANIINNSDELSEKMNEFCNKFGDLHLLINNAGMGDSGSIETLNVKTANQIINVNLNSIIHLTHYTLPYLKKSIQNNPNIPTAIINIGSISGSDFGIGLQFFSFLFFVFFLLFGF